MTCDDLFLNAIARIGWSDSFDFDMVSCLTQSKKRSVPSDNPIASKFS